MIKILARVTRNQFPCETSFPAKPVSLRNQFPCETSFPAKPVSLRNQFPCETSFPAKPVSLRNQFPCETSFPAKPVSLRNQFPCNLRNQFPCTCKTSLIYLISLISWLIFKISYPHIFAIVLLCSKSKTKSDRLIGFC